MTHNAPIARCAASFGGAMIAHDKRRSRSGNAEPRPALASGSSIPLHPATVSLLRHEVVASVVAVAQERVAAGHRIWAFEARLPIVEIGSDEMFRPQELCARRIKDEDRDLRKTACRPRLLPGWATVG
jgi:hypothetical protein